MSLSLVGFGSGPEWDEVYNFFDANNPKSMSLLQQSLEKGPVDWQGFAAATKSAK